MRAGSVRRKSVAAELAAEIHRREEVLRQTFRRYVSPRVADKILEDAQLRDTLLSTADARTHVVVVFADLRGFTSISEQLEPHSVVPLLNEYFSLLTEITFRHEGTVFHMAGDGLMLSRTQPRPADAPRASLADIQNPMVDAYLEALPKGREPRILASRTVFAADDHAEAMRLAEKGLMRLRHRLAATGDLSSGNLVGDLITAMDVHVGTPDEVIASLQTDEILKRATDMTVQSHSIDPPHPFILRSIQLVAEKVAPSLGWASRGAADARRVA